MERTLRLIQRAHEGDKEARDILVEENVGLVWSIVRRFQNRGVESEDLFQIGTIGLIKAVDKFDCSYEVCFSTYAVPMIAILTHTTYKRKEVVGWQEKNGGSGCLRFSQQPEYWWCF